METTKPVGEMRFSHFSLKNGWQLRPAEWRGNEFWWLLWIYGESWSLFSALKCALGQSRWLLVMEVSETPSLERDTDAVRGAETEQRF